MTELFHELFVQILTAVVMTGLIILAVVLGHKLRVRNDRKKAEKALNNTTTEQTEGAE